MLISLALSVFLALQGRAIRKMTSPLESVAALLVTPDNPEREDLPGMDSDRCIALHNAILKHSWVAAGEDPDDFITDTMTWWDKYSDDLDEPERLHPSLRAFLQGARVAEEKTEDTISFFYNVKDLQHPSQMWNEAADSVSEESAILTLYQSHEVLAGAPDGLLSVSRVS